VVLCLLGPRGKVAAGRFARRGKATRDARKPPVNEV
jgi:hypothetical protein